MPGGAGDAQTTTGGVVVVADTTEVSAPPPPCRTPPERRRHPPTSIRQPLGVLLLALAALAGCSATLPGAGAPASIAPADLCPGAGTDAARLTSCLVEDLEATGTGRLGEPLRLKVVVEPAPAVVHRSCRSFLAFGTAFYCPSDAVVYITGASVARDRRVFTGRLPYALATVVAHEAGHRVQFAVDEPGLDDEGDAASRRVEQQADCLAGSWARHAARRGLLDPAVFRDVFFREMQIVSALTPPPGSGLDGYDEVATHGTPEQRVAAFDRGAGTDDPTRVCAITL
jgi:Putative neutral zinc metallopeptidase